MAGGAAAAGLALGARRRPSARSSAGNIKMWWWGEQEAVGIQKWMDDTIKKFKAQTGASVSPTLMDTAQVIPQFTKAAAAGSVPDVQFLFNGIYHMENAWLGYLKPLDGLVSAETIKQGGGTTMSNYEGKTYRTGFYSLGFGVQYNKEHFDKAGLNPTRRRRPGTRSWTPATSSRPRATSRSAAASRTGSSASGASSTR